MSTTVRGHFLRFVAAIVIAVLLAGCASVTQFLADIKAKIGMAIDKDSDFEMMTYEDIMDTQTVRASSAGGARWVPPLVQKVKVPAMIRNGILIPAHEEYVIINDAAYVMDDTVIDGIRRRYGIPSGIDIVSPLKKSDVVIGVFRMNRVFDQSTVVPVSKVSFLLQGKVMEKALALGNDEVAQIGSFLCTFSRERGDDYITANVVESGSRSIQSYTVSKAQALFLRNGYVILPVFEARKTSRRIE